MAYRKFNYVVELKKVEQGKRLLVPADFLISYVLEKYPRLQKRFDKMAGITTVR